ncbi:MAG: hypothetical protein ACI9UN_003688 [Granulosicoccus sp.]|jgi:hypothetical protein
MCGTAQSVKVLSFSAEHTGTVRSAITLIGFALSFATSQR